MKREIFLISLLFSLTLQAAPRWACVSVFYSGASRAVGDPEEKLYTPTGRVVELKPTKMSNQCNTSECYLFSFINYVNVSNANRNENVVVSSPYLVAHKFLEHIREGVWYGTSSPYMMHDLRGGYSYEALHLSRKVGLVPDTWKPQTPLEEWDMDHVYSMLEKKVPEWHKYLVSLQRKYGDWNAPAVRQAEADAYNDLKHLILQYTGPLPTQIQYRDQTITPNQFEAYFGAPRLQRLWIENKPGNILPKGVNAPLDEAMVKFGGAWSYRNGDWDSIIRSIPQWIDAGFPVIVDLNWKEDGHSMLVVGYEVLEGKITRYKVMNSWGPNFGNEGYGWYTPEDIWNNIRRSYKFTKIQ